VTDTKKAAAYLSKYATKTAILSQYSIADRLVICKALHGKRLCGTWGTLKQIKLTRPPCDDKDDWQQLGTWIDIVSTIDTDPCSRATWTAYRRGTCLVDDDLSPAIRKYATSSAAMNILEKSGLDPPLHILEL